MPAVIAGAKSTLRSSHPFELCSVAVAWSTTMSAFEGWFLRLTYVAECVNRHLRFQLSRYCALTLNSFRLQQQPVCMQHLFPKSMRIAFTVEERKISFSSLFSQLKTNPCTLLSTQPRVRNAYAVSGKQPLLPNKWTARCVLLWSFCNQFDCAQRAYGMKST